MEIARRNPRLRHPVRQVDSTTVRRVDNKLVAQADNNPVAQADTMRQVDIIAAAVQAGAAVVADRAAARRPKVPSRGRCPGAAAHPA